MSRSKPRRSRNRPRLQLPTASSRAAVRRATQELEQTLRLLPSLHSARITNRHPKEVGGHEIFFQELAISLNDTAGWFGAMESLAITEGQKELTTHLPVLEPNETASMEVEIGSDRDDASWSDTCASDHADIVNRAGASPDSPAPREGVTGSFETPGARSASPPLTFHPLDFVTGPAIVEDDQQNAYLARLVAGSSLIDGLNIEENDSIKTLLLATTSGGSVNGRSVRFPSQRLAPRTGLEQVGLAGPACLGAWEQPISLGGVLPRATNGSEGYDPSGSDTKGVFSDLKDRGSFGSITISGKYKLERQSSTDLNAVKALLGGASS
ncbi:hypothetical protein DFP72DRAFT_854019 [Ephemerocybe angulata]|uniref:Uncharacterized protein n=1 Tax=Ephemerocybe angulata TaxID=980116 RepID=A0A8H6HK03_9AGAR|nr:hypothetical protein DFP72DRAFT_854019 [Tulosesus angulatus]